MKVDATIILFLFFFPIFFDPLLTGSLLPYIVSFLTILIVHLSIIQTFTQVSVPSVIFFGSLGMVMVENTLFRSLLHINAARKVAAVHECGGNNFSLRYFHILILSVCAWSSSLSLEILVRLPKLPKYLLNRHSSYLSSITFSDCTFPPSSICDPPFQGPSTRLLLLGRIHIINRT